MNTLLLIYNSYRDPLFQNLVLAYIRTLATKTDGSFYLITFEQHQYFISRDERREIKRELALSRIYWYPLVFHSGKFLLLKKLWDFIQSLFVIVYLRIRFRIRMIFTFANVSASIGIILKKFLKMKMIVFSYEPHSEFMQELGYWKNVDWKYKILNFLEKQAGKDSEFILTGTKYMVERLKDEKSKSKIYRAPTAVDEDIFYFRKQSRESVRKQLGIKDRLVFLYLGKFGGLYYKEEIPEISSEIHKYIPEAFFLVITPEDNGIDEIYHRYLPRDTFHIARGLTRDEIIGYLSASDLGINAIPPSPAQKFRSPTKTAEYLLCGLPYITCRGISEDDIYAEKFNVGVVLDRFSVDAIRNKIPELKQLIQTPADELRERCREVGINYRSKARIDDILSEIYQENGKKCH